MKKSPRFQLTKYIRGSCLEATNLHPIYLKAIDSEATIIALEATVLYATNLQASDLEAIVLEATVLQAINLEAISLYYVIISLYSFFLVYFQYIYFECYTLITIQTRYPIVLRNIGIC